MIYYKVRKKDGEIYLEEPCFNLMFMKKTESVFAQCNGHIGVRASCDFKTAEDSRGMYVGGCYNKAFESEVTELVNCPDLTEIKLNIDGQNFYLEEGKLLQYKKSLHIKTGELQTEYIIEAAPGLQLKIQSRRFAAVHNKRLFHQELQITAVRGSVKQLEVVTGINGQSSNEGVSHFRNIDFRVYDKKYMAACAGVGSSHLNLFSAVNISPKEFSEKPVYLLGRRCIHAQYTGSLSKGETVMFHKVSYLDYGNRCLDFADVQSELDSALDDGYYEQLSKHRRQQQEYWKYAEITVDGVTEEEQAAVLFAQYHIAGMAPDQTDTYSIGAKGLTGPGYKGHVFWDAELFLLPFFSHLFPDIAENMLKFRYRGLEGAECKAAEYGYRGAMFPWETAADGYEETPLYAALNIHTGKANRVWSGIKEHHVTADIVYGLWQYYTLTGDEQFMAEYGYELIFKAASFWVSRAVYNEERKRFEILDIIGPDEYTEHIDNNAYTNYMAHYCVSLALQASERLCREDRERYEQLKAVCSMQEAEWRDFVRHIYLPEPDKEGIIPQDDTFLSKQELPDIKTYKSSHVKQSVLLAYSRDQVVNMQVLKQADTVMLLNLFPAMFEPAVVKKNVLYYEQRTLHDSSLSYCAHAQACASIGEPELGWQFFQQAMCIDIDENPNDSNDGIHAAALGGIWNCLIQGFAGVSCQNDKVYITPHLPQYWKRMHFWLKVQGIYYQIVVSHDEISVMCSEKASGSQVFVLDGNEYIVSEDVRHYRTKAYIFDLDGVVVDTAKYHFQAWGRIAAELGFEFSEAYNEQIKGVSRMESLEILLQAGRREGAVREEFTPEQKQELAQRKNDYYLEYIEELDESAILPGIREFLKQIRVQGHRTALGSASKSGRKIIEKLGLLEWFDVIIDGNEVTVPKPEPKVFTEGADRLGVSYDQCIVIEDAAAGVEASRRAGMTSIGVGDKKILYRADHVVPHTSQLVNFI